MKTKKIAVPRYLAERLPSLMEKYLRQDQELPDADENPENFFEDNAEIIRRLNDYSLTADHASLIPLDSAPQTSERLFFLLTDLFEDNEAGFAIKWDEVSQALHNALDSGDRRYQKIKFSFETCRSFIYSNVTNSNIYLNSSNVSENHKSVASIRNFLTSTCKASRILNNNVMLCLIFKNALTFWQKSGISGKNDWSFQGARPFNGGTAFTPEKSGTGSAGSPCYVFLKVMYSFSGSGRGDPAEPEADQQDAPPPLFPSDLFLKTDSIRAALPEISRSQLTSASEGSIEVFAPDSLPEDADYTEMELDQPCVCKDPWELVKQDSYVFIDFGTSSTVAAFQDDKGITQLLRMKDFGQEVRDYQYENPTALEFRDVRSFRDVWLQEKYRPLTEWDSVYSSYDARSQVDDHPTCGMTNIKSWARLRHNAHALHLEDELHEAFDLFPLPAEDCPDAKDPGDWQHRPLDPIEIYGYYLGLCLNTQTIRGGSIYLNYRLSCPVGFDRETKKRVLQGLRRGILRSLPPSLVYSPKWREARFSFDYMATEPEALIGAAIPALGLDSPEKETAFAVFDFGGGTTDFAAGFYRPSTEIEHLEIGTDTTIEILGTSGDSALGGEHLVTLLYFAVVKHNYALLLENGIACVLPDHEECSAFPGSDKLWSSSADAYGNMQLIKKELRRIWENDQDYIESLRNEGKAEFLLRDSSGKTVTATLVIDAEELETIIKNRIEKGVKSFYTFFAQTFRPYVDRLSDKLHVIFAGNSCRSPVLREVFASVKAARNSNVGDYIVEHYEFVDQWLQNGENRENDPEAPVRVTLKNCVALGMCAIWSNSIYLKSDRDIANDDPPFNYTVGTFQKGFLAPLFKRGLHPYNVWFPFGMVRKPRVGNEYILLIGWSSDPAAASAREEVIPQSGCRQKNLYFPQEYTGYAIRIRAVSLTRIELGCFADDSDDEPACAMTVDLD